MKRLLRILLAGIGLHFLLVVLSFLFPGHLLVLDRYQVGFQKVFIEGIDACSSGLSGRLKKKDTFRAGAISMSELSPVLDELKPGTLFFSEHGTAVSARFIRGRWKHCGIYLGTLDQVETFWGKDHALVQTLRSRYISGKEHLVFDSSYEYGVRIHDMSGMAELSARSTLRALRLYEFHRSREQWSTLLLQGMKREGKSYDYCFVLDDDESYYCSEFLYKVLCLDETYLRPSRRIISRDVLIPSDLVQAFDEQGEASGEFHCIQMLSGSRDGLKPVPEP